MGANVYLRSVHPLDYEPPDFDEISRTARLENVDSIELAQRLFEALASTGGYFRDGYSRFGLFGALGLNWLRDVLPLLEDGELLPIEHARALRRRVAAAKFSPIAESEPQLALIEELVKPDLGEREGRFQDLEVRRARLLALLDKSIALNEPLYCAL